jgi:hypothetical protein
MALVLADRVQETTNTTGTGTLTLAGAVSGFQSFAAVGNANTTYYAITSGTDWEVGVGTYTASGTTLSRDTVLSSSAAGAKITVAAGAKVFCTYPSEKAIAAGNGYFPDVFAGTFVDGVVVDYVSGNGRISVGGADGIQFYNGGVGSTLLGEAQNNGNWDFNGTVTVGTGTALGGATNPLLSANGSANNYVQAYAHNTLNGASSSADLVAYADNSTDAHGWADIGFTSSAYADTTYTCTGPGEAYVFGSAPSGSGATGNLVYATDSTGTANAHQWYVGGFTQAKGAYKMQLGATTFTLNGVNLLTTANTASVPSLIIPAGTVLTTATAGAVESDTANTVLYFTGNTTNGRGLIPATQYFRLTANGAATATTISPFFGTNSSIPLVANGVYEIEIEAYFLKNTAGTLTWTITNSTTVTNMTATMIMTAVTGMATAGSTIGQGLVTQTAAAAAFAATASLTTAVNHWAKFKIVLENASSTSVRLNVTNSAGTVTPLRGSFWKATRIANVGTYAA